MAGKIAILTVNIFIPGARSLKDKRQVIRHLKDALKHRYNVSISETDFQDKWQRGQLTLAVVSPDHFHLEKVVQSLKRSIDDLSDAGEIESLTVEYG